MVQTPCYLYNTEDDVFSKRNTTVLLRLFVDFNYDVRVEQTTSGLFDDAFHNWI